MKTQKDIEKHVWLPEGMKAFTMFLIDDVSLVQWGDCHEFGEIIVMHIIHLGHWIETLVLPGTLNKLDQS